MRALTKDWDRHVVAAEDVARGRGFRELRDSIVEYADPQAQDRVLDIGVGTGLLSLELAPHVARVLALDISPAMVEYVSAKAVSAGLTNFDAVVGSAISLPLVDESVDLVVSNYCFHHLTNSDKDRALREVMRVLAPGGRVVFGDMMFQVGLVNQRDRQLVLTKTRAMLRKGPAGVARLLRNAARYVTASWEKPVHAEWWNAALRRAGFVDVDVKVMHHEGGIAQARKPA